MEESTQKVIFTATPTMLAAAHNLVYCSVL